MEIGNAVFGNWMIGGAEIGAIHFARAFTCIAGLKLKTVF
jgi:hypothetical protein